MSNDSGLKYFNHLLDDYNKISKNYRKKLISHNNLQRLNNLLKDEICNLVDTNLKLRNFDNYHDFVTVKKYYNQKLKKEFEKIDQLNGQHLHGAWSKQYYKTKLK